MDCETPWPTTTLHASTDNDTIKMDIVHHNGPRSIPVFTGTVTASDLDLLKGDADAIAKLGDHWKFQWKVTDCTQYGAQLLSCGTGSPTKINETDVPSVSFDTRRLTERSFNSVFEHLQVSLWILIDGRTRQVMLDYDVKDCRIAVR